MRQAAEQGNSEAQFLLGVSFYTNNRNDRDFQKAFSWFLKSANQDYPLAQSMVGRCYIGATGVTWDLEKGIAWLRKAVTTGDNNVAGTLQSVEKLQTQFLKAEQGDIEALFWSGLDSMGGSIFPTDIPQGIRLLTEAAEKGHFGAKRHLADLYLSGKLIGHSEQLVEPDHVKALKWYISMALGGDVNMQYQIGFQLLMGITFEKNVNDGVLLLREAVRNGHIKASMIFAGVLLGSHGNDVPVELDTDLAIQLLEYAMEHGNISAHLSYGIVHSCTGERALGEKCNDVKAYAHISVAGRLGEEEERDLANKTLAKLRKRLSSGQIERGEKMAGGIIAKVHEQQRQKNMKFFNKN